MSIEHFIEGDTERFTGNEEHLEVLGHGVYNWNSWRRKNSHIVPDLRGITLSRAHLEKINFRNADLSDAILAGANLTDADLDRAILVGANLSSAVLRNVKMSIANLANVNLVGAYLHNADLVKSDLTNARLNGARLQGADMMQVVLDNANLRGATLGSANLTSAIIRDAILIKTDLLDANLTLACLEGSDLTDACLRLANLDRANLTSVDLTRADLQEAHINEANIKDAIFDGCRVHGINIWGCKTRPKSQRDLVISHDSEPLLTVDNLKMAHFIRLILDNPEISDAVDTLSKKAVLILGRFKGERGEVLEVIKSNLRDSNYLPIIFSFDGPKSRNFTDTVRTLASLSRFVIVDLSDPNSSPHELMSFAEQFRRVPVQRIFTPTPDHLNVYPMSSDFDDLPQMLPLHTYSDLDELVCDLNHKLLPDIEERVDKVRPK